MYLHVSFTSTPTTVTMMSIAKQKAFSSSMNPRSFILHLPPLPPFGDVGRYDDEDDKTQSKSEDYLHVFLLVILNPTADL